PRLTPGYKKRSRLMGDRFENRPLPIAGIGALSTGPELALRALRPREAVVRVLGYAYAARFGTQLLHGEQAAHHFQQCSQLVRQAPVFGLERPRSLELLAEGARLVEEHLRPGARPQVVEHESPRRLAQAGRAS